MNYTKKLRIFSILNFFCVVYLCGLHFVRDFAPKPFVFFSFLFIFLFSYKMTKFPTVNVLFDRVFTNWPSVAHCLWMLRTALLDVVGAQTRADSVSEIVQGFMTWVVYDLSCLKTRWPDLWVWWERRSLPNVSEAKKSISLAWMTFKWHSSSTQLVFREFQDRSLE